MSVKIVSIKLLVLLARRKGQMYWLLTSSKACPSLIVNNVRICRSFSSAWLPEARRYGKGNARKLLDVGKLPFMI